MVALDVGKAFDNVKHSAIVNNLQSLNVGEKMYSYINSFLTDSKASIPIGQSSLDGISLGNRGTPQGSVLSPILFNIAMIGLPQRL